jgi:hypothetical protein
MFFYHFVALQSRQGAVGQLLIQKLALLLCHSVQALCKLLVGDLGVRLRVCGKVKRCLRQLLLLADHQIAWRQHAPASVFVLWY